MINFADTTFLPTDDAAQDAAVRAGVVTRDLHRLEDLERVSEVFRGVCLPTQDLAVNLLQGLAHSGNYVAGAWRGASLVGGAVGFLAERAGSVVLRSHLVAVSRSDQGSGVGAALKLHQRAWARSRGIVEIDWIYDPLVRPTAWFNLAKLRARVVAYHPNYHGAVSKEADGADETDRCLVRWRLDHPFVLNTPPRTPPADTAVALISSSTHTPIVHDRPLDGRRLMCQIPEDVVAWRRRDPGLAREWRMALRHTMGRAVSSGYRATSFTRDGWYLLEKGGD